MPSSRPIDPSEFDASVKPTEDFFRFVNGGWVKKNPIPSEESRWGSFTILRVEVEKQLKEILDELVREGGAALGGNAAAPGNTAQKVRDFYLVAMDAEKCNRLGIAPLSELFAKIDAIKNTEDLVRTIGYLQKAGVHAWWTPSVEQDEKNAEIMALHLYQGGLGLPDRDYYLNDDEKSAAIRTKYLAYMQGMLKVSGTVAGDITTVSQAIMDLETKLAKVAMTRVELRDVLKMYHKVSFTELAALTPHINWSAYFESLGIPSPEYVIAGQPKFLQEVDGLFETVSLDLVRAYLRWHATNSMAGYLSEDIERLRFDFYGRTFGGVTEMKARWRRVLGILNVVLDDAVAELYVARHFSPDAKRKINALVDHLVIAYRARIEKLDWMSAETKKKAFEKLAAFKRKLGYPDTWKDITALTIGTMSYAENYMHAHAFEFDRQMKKIGKPVDRAEWYMSPQTVNACYQPTLNEILFPAAILQPPFFDPNADDAVNYGGIGTVIGHELTHGFDDQGALFDPVGNLKNWWTEADKKSFDARTARLTEQFDRYEPLPGLRVNGKLTLGENIADLGGIVVAYDAMVLALEDRGGSGATNGAAAAENIDGLTPPQRFFIGYAITERENVREEFLRLQVQTDPHSPHMYRVNGPLSNMDAFYKAFDGKVGDGLWRKPDERVRIW